MRPVPPEREKTFFKYYLLAVSAGMWLKSDWATWIRALTIFFGRDSQREWLAVLAGCNEGAVVVPQYLSKEGVDYSEFQWTLTREYRLVNNGVERNQEKNLVANLLPLAIYWSVQDLGCLLVRV
jgi:hypothetical protein